MRRGNGRSVYVRSAATIVLCTLFLVAWLLGKPGPHALFLGVDNVVQLVAGLVAMALCCSGGRQSRPQDTLARSPNSPRRWLLSPPLLLCAGIAGDVLGQGIRILYEQGLHQPAPFPGWEDAGYLSAYPFLLLGVLLLPTCTRSLAARLRTGLDGLLILAAVVTISGYVLLGPMVAAAGGLSAGTLVGLAYPVGDLLLIACLVLLGARDGEAVPVRRALGLLALALAIIVVTDSIFDYQTLHGGYATGGLLDTGWPLGYMLVGLAAQALRHALRAGEAATGPASTDAAAPSVWRLLLPYLGLPLVGIMIVATQVFHDIHGDEPYRGVLYIGGALLVVLVFIRQVLALLENRRLYAEATAYARQTAALNETLQHSEARYRRLVESAQEGIWQSAPDGTTTFVNPRMAALLGYTADEMIGVPLDAFLDEEGRTVLRANMARRREAAHQGQDLNLQYDCQLRRKDGTSLWALASVQTLFDQEGRYTGHWAMLTDITERKQTEEALRASEARFQALAEHGSDLVSINGPGGTFIYVSPSHRRLLGYDPAELEEQDPACLLHPDDVERVRATFGHAATQGVDPAPVEVRVRHADGSWRIVELIGVNRYGDPAVRGMVVTGRDITARVQAEQARQAQHEAEQASRAKSQFLSRMSHELRTPLNAVLGFAQVLETEDLPPPALEYVQRILHGGQHLLSLINEVLDLARIEADGLSLSVEPVSLAHVVAQALDLITPQVIQAGLAVVAQPVLSSPTYVRADHQRLKQVLLNLLSNAVKYNRPGGAMTLVLEETLDDGDGLVRLGVRDTGAGLASDQLARMFRPFERLGADAAGIEGTGLGLSLTKGLIEAMGGTLEVESAVGQGSTFWVQLPRAATPVAGRDVRPADNTTAITALGAPRTRQRTLLYIEDNAANVALLDTVLALYEDVVLETAARGEEGCARARAQLPDAILLDLHLPDLDGREVLRRLRADPLTRPIPVLVLSADATRATGDQLRAAGASDYLTKPLHVKAFLRALDAVFLPKAS